MHTSADRGLPVDDAPPGAPKVVGFLTEWAERFPSVAGEQPTSPCASSSKAGPRGTGGRPSRPSARPERFTTSWQLEGKEFSRGFRLFSGTFMRFETGTVLTCFVAAVSVAPREFRARIFDRYGAAAALGTTVRSGFDPYDRLTAKLISEAAADELAQIAAAPEKASAAGFVVVVEHRVRA